MSEPEYVDNGTGNKLLRNLFGWLDYMAGAEEKKGKKKKMPRSLRAFLRMAKRPEYDVIKKYFGLLRLPPWRKLLFESRNGRGAFIFLDLLKKCTEDEKCKVYIIGKWEHLGPFEYEFEEDETEEDELVDEDSETGEDNPSDGVSPQKGPIAPD